MTDAVNDQAVERRARSMFGDCAKQRLFKPNRSFAQLSPDEMARSTEGACLMPAEPDRTVLAEETEPA
ncbi:MAG: hypothetical protein P4M00_20680 [Azospirillaceae bacterium]|nr:hypothetical protein [Azospirillaceae bacterium]